MLNYEFILIRYGELALKGKNRKQFEDKLQENIRLHTKDLDIKINRTYGRMYVFLNGEEFQVVAERLKKIFGISSFSPAVKTELDVEAVKESALKAIQAVRPLPSTFKVNVRRPNKSFPVSSQEMNQIVGAHILRNSSDLTVNVHQPDVEVLVELRNEAAYIMCEKIKGAGGLPVGSSGKVMLMLSGGIDSPVAGYLSTRRGLRLEGIHFHSYPFTSERAKQKVVDLTKRLTPYAGNIKLHIVPFTKIQTEIQKHIPEEYSITIMRRMMLRISEGIAQKQKALGIVTGDNLGQVASQTLQSMHTINEVTNFPILRPLVSMDKIDIMNIAQEIDTYDISILPYEDCCTVFQPKSPKTRPTRENVNQLEKNLNIEDLVADAIEHTEVQRFEIKDNEQEDELDTLF